VNGSDSDLLILLLLMILLLDMLVNQNRFQICLLRIVMEVELTPEMS